MIFYQKEIDRIKGICYSNKGQIQTVIGLSVCGRTVPFVLVHEPLPCQKDMDAPEPITYPYENYLVHPHAQ
ncbi:hypothetical protein SAMN04488513_1204 [Pseudozobellia thermophila]|uniref:Uncharacterized protein n=1 Tax=Pseudozobellia thermophila TaxID=192903 RepID=A0A1M6PD89_9FLAO|nr:hypothetical protein SAMN04488513_1204 [Pseudozobellia thermophila]